MGRAPPGRLVQRHRHRKPPAQGASASSPRRHSHGPAPAQHIPPPCFLQCLNKHRICRAGRGRPRRPCLPFTQHPPALWLRTASSCRGHCVCGEPARGNEHAWCLKIHASELTSSRGWQRPLRSWLTFLPQLASFSRIQQPGSPGDAYGWD